jgi:AcrR family transcriptional regulator
MSQSTSMRSMPRQQRGERRMQRLLDAAEQIFAERGYTAATTNEIAARAQTSIGTLYRFFPNKEAIIEHLGERYARELHVLREYMFQPEAVTLPLAQLIDRLVDPIVDLKTSHYGLLSLFSGPNAALHIPPEFQTLVGESVSHIEQLWSKRFPRLDAEDCHLYALIFSQIRQAFLALAFSSPPSMQARIIAELKSNLYRYLQPLDETR